MSVEVRAMENRSAASAVAAGLLKDLLIQRLSSGPQKQASLVVSGGSTPGRCFELLSREPLDWSRVRIVPSDERWVAPDHPESNERMIRKRLLKGEAAGARLLSLYRADIEADQAPGLIEQDLSKLDRPYTASLVGMGEDGHFASLFPDSDNLNDALDPDNGAQCIYVKTRGSPYLRISLTLSALLNTEHMVLLIFGNTKRRILNEAMSGLTGYPVTSLLQHASRPLTVIWAP